MLNGKQSVAGGYKVHVTRGERICRMSPEWNGSRSTDQRFLSLAELFDSVNGRAERGRDAVTN